MEALRSTVTDSGIHTHPGVPARMRVRDSPTHPASMPFRWKYSESGARPSLPGDLSYLREFESIGGLGSSRTLAVGKPHPGLRSVIHARLIVGVLYGP
jgi:hypothetical protein